MQLCCTSFLKPGFDVDVVACFVFSSRVVSGIFDAKPPLSIRILLLQMPSPATHRPRFQRPRHRVDRSAVLPCWHGHLTIPCERYTMHARQAGAGIAVKLLRDVLPSCLCALAPISIRDTAAQLGWMRHRLLFRLQAPVSSQNNY